MASASKPRTDERPTSIGDAELVHAARDGDRFAQDALYRRYAVPAARLAARLLGSTSDTEDLLHDSFLEALTKLDRLRDPSAFRSWLFRIVVMQVRQRIRRRRLLRRLGLLGGSDDALLESLASSAATPEQRAELSLIDELLQRRPAEERIAWMLCRVEGYSTEQAAELIRTSDSTVRRHLAKIDARIARLARVEHR